MKTQILFLVLILFFNEASIASNEKRYFLIHDVYKENGRCFVQIGDIYSIPNVIDIIPKHAKNIVIDNEKFINGRTFDKNLATCRVEVENDEGFKYCFLTGIEIDTARGMAKCEGRIMKNGIIQFSSDFLSTNGIYRENQRPTVCSFICIKN